jgi:hypothetical protein
LDPLTFLLVSFSPSSFSLLTIAKMTFHSTSQRRSGGRDEPAELRQLRKEHGAALVALKELFADWTEEDLLYALHDANGDVNLTTLHITEGKVL